MPLTVPEGNRFAGEGPELIKLRRLILVPRDHANFDRKHRMKGDEFDFRPTKLQKKGRAHTNSPTGGHQGKARIPVSGYVDLRIEPRLLAFCDERVVNDWGLIMGGQNPGVFGEI